MNKWIKLGEYYFSQDLDFFKTQIYSFSKKGEMITRPTKQYHAFTALGNDITQIHQDLMGGKFGEVELIEKDFDSLVMAQEYISALNKAIKEDN